ncbi:PREDICTED: uncharacterized protein LOC105108936 isoform X2 [Populus euphratica]|uniref:Uncharacterized protein LOC105108936 isoform X2 n=1 Tax=Populus euphratica TaxID=75702 RepID=A0AAJ6SZ90_POPEU|nr:PREDICTED: uncharacterized protein LOC105108936 isoform X2 [Populus euphratica]
MGLESKSKGSSLNISSYAKWRKNPIFQSQRCNGMKYNKIDFKPDASLDKDLKLLCQNICLRDWTSEKPVTSLLYALGSMDSRKLLETIKSHLDKTEEIGELVCYYAREGGVVKVAALLMVAWKKLMAVDSFDSKHGASVGRSKIRQFLMSEIERLIDKEMQQLGKSTKIHMDKQNMTSNKMFTDKQDMMSALQLLEIFERAGDGLDQFIQERQCSEMTKEDSAEIVCLLSGLVCTSNPKGTSKCDQWSCIRCSEYELDEGESPSDFISYYSYNRVTDVERQIAYAFKFAFHSPLTASSFATTRNKRPFLLEIPASIFTCFLFFSRFSFLLVCFPSSCSSPFILKKQTTMNISSKKMFSCFKQSMLYLRHFSKSKSKHKSYEFAADQVSFEIYFVFGCV